MATRSIKDRLAAETNPQFELEVEITRQSLESSWDKLRETAEATPRALSIVALCGARLRLDQALKLIQKHGFSTSDTALLALEGHADRIVSDIRTFWERHTHKGTLPLMDLARRAFMTIGPVTESDERKIRSTETMWVADDAWENLEDKFDDIVANAKPQLRAAVLEQLSPSKPTPSQSGVLTAGRLRLNPEMRQLQREKQSWHLTKGQLAVLSALFAFYNDGTLEPMTSIVLKRAGLPARSGNSRLRDLFKSRPGIWGKVIVHGVAKGTIKLSS